MSNQMRKIEDRPHSIKFTEKSLTQQNFKKQCDINVIMEKYQKTGQVSVSDRKAVYGDFSNVPDYLEAFNIVSNAQSQFKNLPGELRQKLNGSPQEFLKWVANPDNKDDLIKYGLMDKPVVAPTEPEPAPEPTE